MLDNEVSLVTFWWLDLARTEEGTRKNWRSVQLRCSLIYCSQLLIILHFLLTKAMDQLIFFISHLFLLLEHFHASHKTPSTIPESSWVPLKYTWDRWIQWNVTLELFFLPWSSLVGLQEWESIHLEVPCRAPRGHVSHTGLGKTTGCQSLWLPSQDWLLCLLPGRAESNRYWPRGVLWQMAAVPPLPLRCVATEQQAERREPVLHCGPPGGEQALKRCARSWAKRVGEIQWRLKSGRKDMEKESD